MASQTYEVVLDRVSAGQGRFVQVDLTLRRPLVSSSLTGPGYTVTGQLLDGRKGPIPNARFEFIVLAAPGAPGRARHDHGLPAPDRKPLVLLKGFHSNEVVEILVPIADW